MKRYILRGGTLLLLSAGAWFGYQQAHPNHIDLILQSTAEIPCEASGEQCTVSFYDAQDCVDYATWCTQTDIRDISSHKALVCKTVAREGCDEEQLPDMTTIEGYVSSDHLLQPFPNEASYLNRRGELKTKVDDNTLSPDLFSETNGIALFEWDRMKANNCLPAEITPDMYGNDMLKFSKYILEQSALCEGAYTFKKKQSDFVETKE